MRPNSSWNGIYITGPNWVRYFRGRASKGANNSAGLKWCFSFSPVDEGDVWGEMRLRGEGEYVRETLAFLVFSGFLKISQKVSMCLATHFYGMARKPKAPGCNYPSCTSKLWCYCSQNKDITISLVVFLNKSFVALIQLISLKYIFKYAPRQCAFNAVIFTDALLFNLQDNASTRSQNERGKMYHNVSLYVALSLNSSQSNASCQTALVWFGCDKITVQSTVQWQFYIPQKTNAVLETSL